MCFCGAARLNIQFQQRPPKEIKKKAITMLSVKELYLADSLEIVEPGWFQKSCLEKVTFPKNLKVISDFAFCDCKRLKYIDLSTSNYLLKIGRDAFRATALTAFEAPPRLLLIGRDAFKQCKYLSTVKLNHNLRNIESGAFQRTAVSGIVIPRTV